MIMLLLPGPTLFGPASVQAALEPAAPAPSTVFDASGKGIGCQSSSTKYKGPGLPKDPPWPPGAEPTPSPTPSPTPIVDDPALDAGAADASEEPAEGEEPAESEEPEAIEPEAAEPQAEAATYGFAQGELTPTSELITGLDVSHHNGDIDYAAVKEAGHRFVFIKATQDNDFIDPMFPTNLARARAAGLAAGAYHFFDYTLDGREQADHFVDRLEAVGGIDDALPPVVDVECWAPIGASIHAVSTARLRDFVERVYERIGRWPLIYTSTFMWREVVGNAEGFGQLPMWAACWGCEQPISIAPGWDEWVFWQEGLTRIPGVGRLDGNYFSGSRKELRALKTQPFAIAGGDAATGGGRVELDLGARTGTHIRTSPDGKEWSDWARLRSAAPTATIPKDEGTYEVFAQLKAAPGLKSPVMSDSIYVDATPPEVSTPSVVLREGPLGSGEAFVPLTARWVARDATAGLADASVATSCGEGATIRTEAPGAAEPKESVTWTAEALAFPAADCTVTAIGRDEAGNASRATSAPFRAVVEPAEGANASATVSGSEVGLIARRGPDAGRVAILRDGEAVGLLDLYAPTEEAPAVVWVAGLPAGEHTLEIEATDDSQPAVDGFVTLMRSE